MTPYQKQRIGDIFSIIFVGVLIACQWLMIGYGVYMTWFAP